MATAMNISTQIKDLAVTAVATYRFSNGMGAAFPF
jgi:hypothetical protein